MWRVARRVILLKSRAHQRTTVYSKTHQRHSLPVASCGARDGRGARGGSSPPPAHRRASAQQTASSLFSCTDVGYLNGTTSAGGRARRGEVASVERAPSCSKPKSMATGMSSRPSLSTGSSWIRAMLPPTRDSKATNRRRRARRVIFRSRVWRWRRTQCRDRTRPRGKKPGGSDARHFSDRMPIRGDQTQSARVRAAPAFDTRLTRRPVSDRPNHRTCPNLSPPSGGRDLCARHNERLVRLPEQVRREPTPGDRGRGASLPTHARSAERASDRPASTDVIV